jgi:antitoxin component of MazEF toxin-antitoxin module
VPKGTTRRDSSATVQKLWKTGHSYVVTVPKAEVERRGWAVGQLLAVELTELEVRPVSRDELDRAFEERWERNAPAMQYLADQ